MTVHEYGHSCQTGQKQGSGEEEQSGDAVGFLIDMRHVLRNMGCFGCGGVGAEFAQLSIDILPQCPGFGVERDEIAEFITYSFPVFPKIVAVDQQILIRLFL